MSVNYCSRCLYPDTKPDLLFDEDGVCSACNSFASRQEVDWDARKAKFKEVTDSYRSQDGSNYDCVVPVSGGKDSTYQVLRVLEAGLNPLCVTATTDDLSEIGRYNLENTRKLGVDHIEISTNPVVRRRINRLALEQIGDISWPEHVTIFTVPVRVAVQMNIPLIIWGENPQHEYGGPAAAQKDNVLTRRWLEEFGGLLGLRVSDLTGQEQIETRDLIQYKYPTDEDLQRVGVTGIFLGYYYPWDGYQNALYAQANGFRTFPTAVEGEMVSYENLDNHQMGLHDYLKYIKYGFGRATDLACNHIRRGRLTREDGLRIIAKHDGVFPQTYLGKDIADILAPLDMTVDEFVAICDRFTNKKLFVCDSKGRLVKDKHGRLRRKYIESPSS